MSYKLRNIYNIKIVYLKEMLLYPNSCDIKMFNLSQWRLFDLKFDYKVKVLKYILVD